MIRQFFQWMGDKLWTPISREATSLQKFVLVTARITIGSVHRSLVYNAALRASALTYYFMLGLVPLMGVSLGIAKGFGLEERFQKELYSVFAGTSPIATHLLEYGQALLDSATTGVLATVGVLGLIYTIYLILNSLESIFNECWDVATGRGYTRMLTDYISILTLGPIIFFWSKAEGTNIISQFSSEDLGAPTFFQKLFSWALMWLMFTLMYIVIPNRKVPLRAAVIGGVIGGSVYQMFEYYYIQLQYGAASIEAIYGALAALPLFLIWIQASWYALILGAHVSSMVNNFDRYAFGEEAKKISWRTSDLLALYITHQVIRDFSYGNPAKTQVDFAKKLNLPEVVIEDVLRRLIAARILTEVASQAYAQDRTYQPAQPLTSLTIARVLGLLHSTTSSTIHPVEEPELAGLRQIMRDFDQMMERSQRNILLSDLDTASS